MFPTRSKEKISASLSYPANAKLISEALADVPQAQELSISFAHWQYTARLHQCSMPYPVMSVEYSHYRASQYTSRQFEVASADHPRWNITVQPVPSVLKHHVKELLRQQALPRVRAWLLARRDLIGYQGTQSITIWYDEAKDELLYGEHQHP